MEGRLDIQVLSTFDTSRIEVPLRRALTSAGVHGGIGFTSRERMKEYMLTPPAETEHIAGTVVLARVEDWLRDQCSPAGSPGDAWAREELKGRVREFASEISILAYRGKPVWFMACPSVGWVAETHKLTSLCRTYTNLLAARTGNVSQITVMNWPAGLAGNDAAADQAENIPFTQDGFDRLGEFVAGEVARALANQSGSAEQRAGASPELAAYLAGLEVRVVLVPADSSKRAYIDKIIRTAASFSLSGEQPRIQDSEVDAAIASEQCLLVSVSDRLAEHGPSGVILLRDEDAGLAVDWLSLSCTVLGKQVEYAVVSTLAQMARERGRSKVIFEYRSSARNQPIKTFLESLADSESPDRFILPVADAESRINARAVNPGAWNVNASELKRMAGSGA